jgi:eukaryotic-like serine/threonine-protein kinase
VAQAAAVLARALRVSVDRRQEALFLTDLGMAVAQRAPAGNERVLAQLHSAVGQIRIHNADYAGAVRAQRQALEVATRAYGPDVGAVAAIEMQLGQALAWMAQYPEAQEHLTRALATIERAEGPEHPKMGSPLGIMATFYGMQGRNAEAVPYLQRAIAIMERSSADNRNTGSAYHNLGLVLRALGRNEEATRYFEKALQHKEAQPSPSPNSVVSTLSELAKVHAQQRQFPQAHAYARRARELAEAKLAENSEWRLVTWWTLAYVLTDEGRFAEAVPLLQRVLAQEKALRADPMGIMSMARFQLAQVRWALKSPRAEVLALLQSAREAYARANNTLELQRVERWAQAQRLELAPLEVAKSAP